MPKKQYLVALSEVERARLRALVGRGVASARTLTHARILLKADRGAGGPGWADQAAFMRARNVRQADVADVIASASAGPPWATLSVTPVERLMRVVLRSLTDS